MTFPRVLELEGVHNFRDFGGYGVAGGGRVRPGVLWRSGQHGEASEADLARIADLGLTLVFDLRSSAERSRMPCRRPEGFVAQVVSHDEPAHAMAPHIEAAKRERTVESTRETMRRSYSGMPFRPGLVASVRRMLADLQGLEGAALVNCMAGKDRTGFAVAMVQSALGVHRDDILADYLLTNTAGDAEARIAAGARVASAARGPLDPEVARVLMGVEAEYLDRAFAAIDEWYGSLDTYRRDVLELDEAGCDRLRESLVEG